MPAKKHSVLVLHLCKNSCLFLHVSACVSENLGPDTDELPKGKRGYEGEEGISPV